MRPVFPDYLSVSYDCDRTYFMFHKIWTKNEEGESSIESFDLIYYTEIYNKVQNSKYPVG